MLKIIDGQYVVTIGRHADRTLQWCVKWRSNWLIEWARPSASTRPGNEFYIAIVWDALKERERKGNATLARVPLNSSIEDVDKSIPVRW